MGGHSLFLVQGHGMRREEVESAREGRNDSPLGPKEKALVGFARRVAESPDSIEPKDIQVLRSLGFSDAEIVEALVVIAMSSFTNTISMALKLEGDLGPEEAANYF